MKQFGKKKAASAVKRVEFTLDYERDGQEVTERFLATPRPPGSKVAGFVQSTEKEPAKAIGALIGIIRNQLDDTDGTPRSWAPSVKDGIFVGPDGETYEEDLQDEFLKYEAGSSRRRFAYLMEKDDSVDIEATTLTEMFKWLVEQAADRPTQPSV